MMFLVQTIRVTNEYAPVVIFAFVLAFGLVVLAMSRDDQPKGMP